LLEKLLGAPAIVVNNNAAAIFLVLNELASDGEVIVSRGELIEIGDGFRIPDIMARSGVTLRETGTTNRTALSDYRDAVSEKTRMLLRVHPSNFRIVGFTARPALDELVALGGELQLPVVEDLGSGCLYDFAQQGFENEPPVVESLRAGVDLVTFSGDKLLGGPQAGIIAGKPEWLRRVRRNPLFRALRVDKLTCAALEATLRDYLFGRYDRIPVLRMIRASAEEIRRRAEGFVADLSLGDSISIELAAGESVLGGGSTPAQSIPTTLIRIQPGNGQSVARIEARLRQGDPPVVARIEDNCLLIDLRTVHPKEEEGLSHGLRHAFGEGDDNELEVGRDFL
jgi:L-seryl-tRNA(Ser) seleniumtransferase